MDATTQRALIERSLSNLEAKATDSGATETLRTVHDYRDEQRFRGEVDRIFKRFPLIVAHESELGRPGDFLTEHLFGVPILLTRSPSGRINAFVNVCRHRGAKVVDEPCGRHRVNFVCPYHAWTYDVEGRLHQVPDQQNSFPNLAPARMGLLRLPVAVRHGFVWARLTPEDDAPAAWEVELDEFVTPVGPDLDAYGFERYVFYRKDLHVKSCNWKAGMESFFESYHFAVLHKNSTNHIFVHNSLVLDKLGMHVRMIVPKRRMGRLSAATSDKWDIRPNATILYSVFPNTCIFIEKGIFIMLQFWPDAAGRCRVKVTHVVERNDLNLRAHWEENIRLFYAAIREDLDILESMQQGYESGAIDEVIFGRNEVGCRLFQDSVDRAMGAPPTHVSVAASG
jgi:phenylpropionate dioxygenase-like ring-hydroxylating dioxygenase large terminal subunit